MKIYQSEINDGLGDLLKNNTVAYCSVAKVMAPNAAATILENILKNAGPDLALAENKDQLDLFYLQSILVSTGWNKNDDVFDVNETWAARNTPEDKPFNFMHNEKDIIGHITGNSVVDFDGNTIDSNLEFPPGPFNILTNAVIYMAWSDTEQRERINTLIEEIQQDKWFVSMECLFPAFDYALLDQNGETKVLPRTEASAFLTKHLRAYGGDGLYQDYKIGRLLRNLAFSGKGLVSKPANPRSVILSGSEFFDESKSQILTVSSIKEKSMSDNLEKRIAELQSKLEQAEADNKQLMEKVVAEKEAEYQSKIEGLEATISEQGENIAVANTANETLSASITELEAQVADLQKQLASKDEEMKEMKKKEENMKRKAELESAGLEAEEAAKAIESLQDVSDDAFAAFVDIMKKKTVVATEATDSTPEPQIEQEVDSAEAGEEALEDVQPEVETAVASIDPEVDEAETLRSVASEWIGSFLQTVPQNK